MMRLFRRLVSLSRRPLGREVAMLAAFCALSVVMTWPLAYYIRNGVSDKGDPYLSAWIMWWDYYQTFRDPIHLFQAPIFYPYQFTLAFSEHYYGIALLFFPLYALGFTPLTVQAVATLLGFAFSGYGMFRLTRTATGSTLAAWVAGIGFAFAPYRFQQLPHLVYIFAGWLPLTLEALILFARERTRKRAAWLGFAFLMNGLSVIHWFVLILLPLGAAVILLVQRAKLWRDKDFWLRGGLAMVVALLALLPFLWPYQKVKEMYGLVRDAGETARFSALPADWLKADERNKIWAGFGQDPNAELSPERSLFPGLLLPFLALAAFIPRKQASFGQNGEEQPQEQSSQRFTENYGVARGLGLILLVMGFAGSLGMNFAFHRLLFEYVFIFRSIRVPARWTMIACIGLALLAGLGATRLGERLVRQTSRKAWATVGVIVCGLLLFELRAAPLNIKEGEADPDAVSLFLKETPMRGGVAHLPLGKEFFNCRYTLRQADHRKPLITAFSGFVTPLEEELERLSSQLPVSEKLLDVLENAPTSYLVVHWYALPPAHQESLGSVLEQAIIQGRVRPVRSFPVGVSREDIYVLTKNEPDAANP